VVPSLSILAEPPVAVVDKVAERKGNGKLAEEYLKYLYSPEAQEIAARHYYRPFDKKIAAKYAKRFPTLKLVTIDDTFGGWARAQHTHFSDGGIFDQIYGAK
jgi:sulfate transport system substrate-binding protein